MGFEMRRIDHQRVSPVALTRQFQEHPGEDAFLAPPLPTTLERLVRAISFGRITPSQAIAIDEYNPG